MYMQSKQATSRENSRDQLVIPESPEQGFRRVGAAGGPSPQKVKVNGEGLYAELPAAAPATAIGGASNAMYDATAVNGGGGAAGANGESRIATNQTYGNVSQAALSTSPHLEARTPDGSPGSSVNGGLTPPSYTQGQWGDELSGVTTI
jgi:hypothetical protein